MKKRFIIFATMLTFFFSGSIFLTILSLSKDTQTQDFVPKSPAEDQVALLAAITPAYTVTGGAAYEDLTTYTENDTPGRLTETATKVTVTGMTRNEIINLRKDFGASHFNAINIQFDMCLTSYTGNGLAAFAVFTNTANTCVGDDYITGTGNIFATLGWNGTETSCAISINNSGIIYAAGPANTIFYCTLVRAAASDTVTLNIYTTAARTTHITGSPIQASGVGTGQFRYLYAASSYYTYDSYIFNGYAENFLIQ